MFLSGRGSQARSEGSIKYLKFFQAVFFFFFSRGGGMFFFSSSGSA